MFIAATGMTCPIGLSAAAACAAYRAKISAFGELAFADAQREPIIGARLPGSPERGPRPWTAMLTAALADLFNDAPSQARWEHVPLVVGLAEADRPGASAALGSTIIAEVQQALMVKFHAQYSRTLPRGHVAGFEGLRVAHELLNSGAAPGVIVAGVDSLLPADTLAWLAKHHRLKTSTQRDGVIPGEAAAAVLVQRSPTPTTVTTIAGLGSAKEQAHILSGEPLLGLGLASAAKSALDEARLALHEVDGRLSDVTGELYGFKELPLVTSRLMRVRRATDQPVWTWADSIGDSGAAAGIAQLVVADDALRKGYAPGDRLLCLTSSAGGDRAAAVLRRHTSQAIERSA